MECTIYGAVALRVLSLPSMSSIMFIFVTITRRKVTSQSCMYNLSKSMCSYTYNQSGFKWYPSVIGRAPADADLVNVEMHLESVSQ